MKREHIFAHYEEDATRHWKLQEGGYACPMSVRQGERITFHISNSRSYYDIFVFHEGANRRLVIERPPAKADGIGGRTESPYTG